MAVQALPLRDIHQPPPPPWWPPAPGWWLAAALVLAALACLLWWRQRRRRRRADALRLFEARKRAAATPALRVAAMSELLRRAARRRDARADRLQGEAWLAFLDGAGEPARQDRPFSQGPGRVLLDGGYRRAIAEEDAAAVLPLARSRYLDLATARR